MQNIEILREIDKMIKLCAANIKSAKETETIISEIEKLLGLYKAESDIEKQIKKNRQIEVESLKKMGLSCLS